MTSRQRIKVKTKAVSYLGGKCIMCGYCKCIDALDFHHRDATTKTFQISSALHAKNGLSSKWEFIKPELDKCDLMCGNCHAELHAANHVSRRSVIEPRIPKLKAQFSGWPSLEDVTHSVKTVGYRETGRIIGVSDNAVRKHLKKHGISISTDIRRKNDNAS